MNITLSIQSYFYVEYKSTLTFPSKAALSRLWVLLHKLNIICIAPTVNGIRKYLKYQEAETRLKRGVIFKLEYRFPTNLILVITTHWIWVITDYKQLSNICILQILKGPAGRLLSCRFLYLHKCTQVSYCNVTLYITVLKSSWVLKIDGATTWPPTNKFEIYNLLNKLFLYFFKNIMSVKILSPKKFIDLAL